MSEYRVFEFERLQNAQKFIAISIHNKILNIQKRYDPHCTSEDLNNILEKVADERFGITDLEIEWDRVRRREPIDDINRHQEGLIAMHQILQINDSILKELIQSLTFFTFVAGKNRHSVTLNFKFKNYPEIPDILPLQDITQKINHLHNSNVFRAWSRGST